MRVALGLSDSQTSQRVRLSESESETEISISFSEMNSLTHQSPSSRPILSTDSLTDLKIIEIPKEILT